MTGSLKWFTRTDDAFVPTDDTVDEAEDNRQDCDALPSHVQEFLAMKAAAGV